MSDQKRKFKFTTPVVVLLVIISLMLGFIIALAIRPSYNLDQLQQRTQSLSTQELWRERLRLEIVRLQVENTERTSMINFFTAVVPFITAIVAIGGITVTIWRQSTENNRQKELDRYQRELDRKQREAESRRLLDEKFSSIIEALGSDQLSIKVSAAVSILTFLKPEYEEYHEQVYLILLANLKIEQDLQVNRLLVQGFEKAIRAILQKIDEPDEENALDLSGTHLYRIDLSGLDLSYVDLAFADLRLANLKNCKLYRMSGYKTNFEKATLSHSNLNEARISQANLAEARIHDSNLVSANLKETILSGAQIYRSKLQSAHMEDAIMFDVHFEEANISDAFFSGAKMNNKTRSSIKKAYNWQKAHFDEDF